MKYGPFSPDASSKCAFGYTLTDTPGSVPHQGITRRKRCRARIRFLSAEPRRAEKPRESVTPGIDDDTDVLKST